MTSTLCCAKCVTRMDWTLALLVVSFLGELVGTATVAVNYFIAAQTAREMQQALARESAEYQRNPLMAELKGEGPAYFEHIEVKQQLHATRERLASQLSPKWYLTIGLIALAVGSIAGFLAGLINVV